MYARLQAMDMGRCGLAPSERTMPPWRMIAGGNCSQPYHTLLKQVLGEDYSDIV